MWPRLTLSRCEAHDENLNVGMQRIKRSMCHLFVVNAVSNDWRQVLIRLCGSPRWQQRRVMIKITPLLCGQCGQEWLWADVKHTMRTSLWVCNGWNGKCVISLWSMRSAMSGGKCLSGNVGYLDDNNGKWWLTLHYPSVVNVAKNDIEQMWSIP